jgi:tryptophan 2,3-dioxygenase
MSRPGEPVRAESYSHYLKVPELLQLQKRLSSPPEHDEMLFIVIHQVYELWFKLMIHEIGALMAASKAGDARRAARVYRRLIEIQRVLLQQIPILETMTPADFLRFRDHLNPASGFQSRQFRELEFLSGMKDTASLPFLSLTPEERANLEARLQEPDLRDAFDLLLRKAGFDVPEGAAAHDARVAALKTIYAEHEKHDPLYTLCESMIEYDENFQLWRHHHILMVERMIGNKRGTGGSEGVNYLATTLRKRCFPELWEVRTHLGDGSAYGAGGGPGSTSR